MSVGISARGISTTELLRRGIVHENIVANCSYSRQLLYLELGRLLEKESRDQARIAELRRMLFGGNLAI